MARWNLSRRGFLGATGAVTVGIDGLGDDESTARRRDTESKVRHVEASDVVLSRSDLVGSEEYVERPVDAAEAPLTRHIRNEVESFTGEHGAATGFVNDGGSDLPLSVESAAFPTDAPWQRIVSATAAWFGETHGSTPTIEWLGRETVEWSVTTDEEVVDAGRVDRLDGLLLFTVVAGEQSNQYSPRSAIRQYGRGVRRRACAVYRR